MIRKLCSLFHLLPLPMNGICLEQQFMISHFQAFTPVATAILPENKQIVQQVNSPASLYSAENQAEAFKGQMEAQGVEAHVEGLSLEDQPPMQHRPSLYGEDEGSHPMVGFKSSIQVLLS